MVDKVDIRKILLALLDKGFNVRLPTEKIKPIAVPVGIQPTMEVKGRTVNLALKVGHLKITEHMIWLGAEVAVAIEPEAGGKARPGPKAAKPAAKKAAPAPEEAGGLTGLPPGHAIRSGRPLPRSARTGAARPGRSHQASAPANAC